MITKRLSKRFIYMNIAIILACVALIIHNVKNTEKTIKKEFILNASIASEMIDLDYLMRLTGTEGDIGTYEHTYLEKKFKEIVNLNANYQYVFLMGKNDNDEFFYFIEVKNNNNKIVELATPGTIYDEHTGELLYIFNSKKPAVTKPITDNWGKWVSAIVPILNPETGEVIAIFGIDKLFSIWSWLLINRYVYLVFAVVMIITMFIITTKLLLQRKEIVDRISRVNRQRGAINDISAQTLYERFGLVKSLEKLAVMIADILTIDLCSIWLLNDEKTALECKAVSRDNAIQLHPILDITILEHPDLFTTLHKETVKVFSEVSKVEHIHNYFKSFKNEKYMPKSIIICGFLYNKNLVGIVVAENYTLKHWTTDEEVFINTTAAILGQLISREKEKKAENELLLTRFRFLNSIETMLDGFVYFDEFLNCNFTNSKTLEILKLDSQTYKNSKLWEMMPNDFATSLRGILNNALEEGQNHISIEYFNSLDKWIEIKIFPAYKEITCMFSDVTIEKHKEKVLLDNHRLSIIGEITTSFAHDFNNYLQIVSANIQVLDKKLTDGNLGKYTKNILTATSDAATRVEILQRFAGAKHSKSEYCRVSLNKIVEDEIQQSIFIWKTEPEKHGITIEIKQNLGVIPDFYGNENEIKSVIYTIIQNAVESMPQGGVISFTTSVSDIDICLSISDNGIGIPKEVMDKIFEPFFTTKSFNLGKGLGLSNAHNIISEHKGSISVYENRTGKGTTFDIYLPLHDFKEEDENLDDSSNKKQDKRILWVDDDDDIRSIGVEMLESLDYKVVSAESGATALKLLDESSYDILITDIGMPNMNGWQLIEKVNEKFKGRIKIAVLSGWGAQVPEEQKIEYGVEKVLSKPIKMAQLAKLIEDL